MSKQLRCHSCARCFCSQRIAEQCSAIGRDALRAYCWSRLKKEMSSPSKTRAPLLRVSGAAASVTCTEPRPSREKELGGRYSYLLLDVTCVTACQKA